MMRLERPTALNLAAVANDAMAAGASSALNARHE